MREKDSAQALVREVVDGAVLDQRGVARVASVSEAALLSWLACRRSPSDAALAKLADGLEARGKHLAQQARRLRAFIRSRSSQ